MSEDKTVIYLDDLIQNIIDHLDETDENYRAIIANRLKANYTNDDDVIEGIEDVLYDSMRGEDICELATELLTDDYSYDDNGIATVTTIDNELKI